MHESSRGISGLELLTPRIAKSDFGTVVAEFQWESVKRVEGFERTLSARAGFLMEPNYITTDKSTDQPGRQLRCIAGEIFLVVVDVRVASPTFGKTQTIYLAADDLRVARMPSGLACGYLVTSPNATVEERMEHSQGSGWEWLDWRDSDWPFRWPVKPTSFFCHEAPSLRLRNVIRTRCRPPRPVVINASLVSKKLRRPAMPIVESRSGCEGGRDDVLRKGVERDRNERILVIGSQGQLGRDLCDQLCNFGSVIRADRRYSSPQKEASVLLDMARPASLRQLIRDSQPTLIVNASSMTGVVACEKRSREAQLINATAPMIIAEEAAKLKAPIIHFCTSLVYGGGGSTPWRECDPVSPKSQYARTKSLGSQAVLGSPVAHLVLRSSWLYSVHGINFVRTIIERAAMGRAVVGGAQMKGFEQYGTPTPTSWLAMITAQLLTQAPGSLAEWLDVNGGLFHATPNGFASQSEVVEHILNNCSSNGMQVKAQPIRDGNRNSLNCRLDCSRLLAQLGVHPPSWRSQMEEQVRQILQLRKPSRVAAA